MSRPDVTWDKLFASKAFRELFRYRMGATTLIYNLVVTRQGEAAELWRVDEIDGQQGAAKQEATFSSPDDALTELQKIERALKKAGWKEVSASSHIIKGDAS